MRLFFRQTREKEPETRAWRSKASVGFRQARREAMGICVLLLLVIFGHMFSVAIAGQTWMRHRAAALSTLLVLMSMFVISGSKYWRVKRGVEMGVLVGRTKYAIGGVIVIGVIEPIGMEVRDTLKFLIMMVGTGLLLVLSVGAISLISGFVRQVEEREAVERGGCQKCGYDMRATPRRCPECGWPGEPTGGTPSPDGVPRTSP